MKVQEIVDFIFDIAPNPSWADENIFEFRDGRLLAVAGAYDETAAQD